MIHTTDGITRDYFEADVVTAQDYYPFGMLMPGRTYSAANGYRYGFNGKENDDEVKGEGNQQDYGMRIYDPRVGRFLSVDPLTSKYAWYTPYQFAGNKPLWCIDVDGLEDIPATSNQYPEPYSQEYFTNWAKNDVFYKGPASRGESVILIQNYRVIYTEIMTNTLAIKEIHKTIVLKEGNEGAPITYIIQDNATFYEDGRSTTGTGLTMRWGGSLTSDNDDYLEVKEFVITKRTIFNINAKFESNKTKVLNEENLMKELKPLSNYLKKNPKKTFTVFGNSVNPNSNDDAKMPVDNKAGTLGELKFQRAEAVKKILENLGVDSKQIITQKGSSGKAMSAEGKLETKD